MEETIPVFQFEIRYNHILNFSQIARKMLAPYFRLAQSFKIDKQDTLEERITLQFDDDNYQISVDWDRIIIKGNNVLNPFAENNSPVEIPFFTILNKVKELEGFKSVLNLVFVALYVKELDLKKEDLFTKFAETFLNPRTESIFSDSNDLAVVLEKKNKDQATTITFGPYIGTEDLSKRALKPLNIGDLSYADFTGVMMEYKKGYTVNNPTFSDFQKLAKESNKIFKRTWKML